MLLYDLNAAAILVFALALDAAIGDPGWLWRRAPHPAVLFGMLIEWLESRLNSASAPFTGWLQARRAGGTPEMALRDAGTVATAALVVLGGAVGAGLHWLFMQHPAGIAAEIAIVAILLAQRSLHEHVSAVAAGFREGGLEAAREAVSLVVGRDPDRLDRAGICRAAIETTAENFSDGVVAPAFWYLAAGLPGILIYKAVNTADSMIGHRTPRYEHFGWAAAKLDDAMNFIPARLSAFFILAASLLPDFNARNALAAVKADARQHRSPNAGWPEAAMAGALDLALAGPRVYASGTVDDAWMNAGGSRDAQPSDIGRGLALFTAACKAHFGFAVLIAIGFAAAA